MEKETFRIMLGDITLHTITHSEQLIAYLTLEKVLFPDNDEVYLETEKGFIYVREISMDSPNYACFKRI